jgi:hypothetical protein
LQFRLHIPSVEEEVRPRRWSQLETYAKVLHTGFQLCLAAIQRGYDFILFEKALDFPQLSLCSQTRMKFLKRAVTNQKIK